MFRIYMYLDSGRMVEMEEVETIDEAVYRCKLYFNRNSHHYYAMNLDNMEMTLLTDKLW